MAYPLDGLSFLLATAIAAGAEILNVYHKEHEITLKADRSPLTVADRLSHQLIKERLGDQFPEIPLLSEEGRSIDYSERKSWRSFWLVDPLDGTKEFIRRNDEFTVNIALIQDGVPIIGIIYVPVSDELYFSGHTIGTFKLPNASSARIIPGMAVNDCLDIARALPLVSPSDNAITVIGSRSHRSDRMNTIIATLKKQLGEVGYQNAGSSLKFARIAEGVVDCYPRLGPTMEWDTAAGQCLVESIGGKVLRIDTMTRLVYNKADLHNPFFVVLRKGLEFRGGNPR